ncbi:ADP-ribosylglycohydrolase family protein [Micromonospora sp. NPDC049891]|uniref:ADP-ribosylglycohydrolase family protein n=1 Tax=Micromonospora sp. NPDC049891 TaxID=3155655 RepID=UPI0033C52A52
MPSPADEDASVVVERVAAALTAYACGDALGLPYEGKPATGDGDEEIERPRAGARWAAGETSDDTALTLLAARSLVDAGGDADAVMFLSRLAALDPVKGAGPSTRAAVAHFRRFGEVPDDRAGATNGAPMRALPVGWSTPPTRPELLAARTVELTRATHRSPEALVAACVMAGCASWSVTDAWAAGGSAATLLDVAVETLEVAQRVCGAAPRLAALLGEVVDGGWRPPAAGVSLDPGETVAAVLHCVRRADSLRGGLLAAVRLGGDVDTVAALVGGLLGARSSVRQVRVQLPWSARMLLPDEVEIRRLAAALVSVRAAAGR